MAALESLEFWTHSKGFHLFSKRDTYVDHEVDWPSGLHNKFSSS